MSLSSRPPLPSSTAIAVAIVSPLVTGSLHSTRHLSAVSTSYHHSAHKQVARSACTRFLSFSCSSTSPSTCFKLSRASPSRLFSSASPSSASSSASIPRVLIWVEHDTRVLNPATASLITAARQIHPQAQITLLLTGAGEKVAALAKQCAAFPITNVLAVDNEAYAHQLPENLSALVARVIKPTSSASSSAAAFDYLLVPTTSNGKNILGRVAVLLDSQPVTDVIAIKSANTFVRPIYAGNALATVELTEDIKLLSIRPTNFERISSDGNKSASTSPIDANLNVQIQPTTLSQWINDESNQSERPNLATARVVVSGGRGMKSGENFALLSALADTLNGAVGATRAAVDAGMVPNDYQVGQTGKIVAPDLYIAAGISGAIQHLAGMKDSKIIVAINKDKEAPIFQVSDYGIVDDLFKAVPELTQRLKQAKA